MKLMKVNVLEVDFKKKIKMQKLLKTTKEFSLYAYAY
jgi:hypothetical protein